MVLVAALVLVIFLFRVFLSSVENWSCISMTDPLHPHFAAIDFSSFIFGFTYVPVLLFVVLYRVEIKRLQVFVLAYVFIVLTRMLCMTLFPFCEPGGAIPLRDGLLGTLLYPGGYSALDLLYSGHTATLFLVLLCSGRRLRWWLVLPCALVPVMLVLQKVHYTVDVLVAFPVCWGCYVGARWMLRFDPSTGPG